MRLALAALLLALAFPTAAQSVVGTAIIGGKRAELLSDKTWRFSSGTTPANCVPINHTMSFCGSILDWKPTSTVGTDFVRLFSGGSRTYGGVIYEDVGSADGLDMEFMRNLAIENAAAFTGVPPEEIPIHEVAETTVDGVAGETVSYGARMGTLDFVYQNTILNSETTTIQFVVWTIAKELTDEARTANRNFLDAFKLDLPEATQ